MKIALPMPVSANRYWRTYMPKGFKAPVTVPSDKAREYKALVGWSAKAAGWRAPLAGRVSITITLYPACPQDAAKRAKRDPANWDDDVRCIDLDNCLKVTIDALKGICYDDDKQIRRIVAERGPPVGTGGVIVEVVAIEPAADLITLAAA